MEPVVISRACPPECEGNTQALAAARAEIEVLKRALKIASEDYVLWDKIFLAPQVYWGWTELARAEIEAEKGEDN